ncbi:hypothetical protein MKZ38_008718 [Zalerion maritima]|uniref:Uncharacterized protein n=1 Tax=Zalerion maritima TaxID=339359 RepID=A0AAD5WVH4_9PEZI|nr:hypothetical protein MKZ38_008718 [Zalerion maritima]
MWPSSSYTNHFSLVSVRAHEESTLFAITCFTRHTPFILTGFSVVWRLPVPIFGSAERHQLTTDRSFLPLDLKICEAHLAAQSALGKPPAGTHTLYTLLALDRPVDHPAILKQIRWPPTPNTVLKAYTRRIAPLLDGAYEGSHKFELLQTIGRAMEVLRNEGLKSLYDGHDGAYWDAQCPSAGEIQEMLRRGEGD